MTSTCKFQHSYGERLKTASALHRLGKTQRSLLRYLLSHQQGATIDDLCAALGISHNAVRQHLTALTTQGFVARGPSLPTGGRPRAVYVIEAGGRQLFPRNYGLLAHELLDHLHANSGGVALQELLTAIGTRLGSQAAEQFAGAKDRHEITQRLAGRLDQLGYETELVDAQDGPAEIQAWNCVFHDLAHQHPDVCRLDLAFMRAATGHSVQRTACMLHGQSACRFRVGERIPENTLEP